MAHTDEKVCLTVVCFLTREHKVLLANHPAYNTWLPVGGHIDPGEDPEEALFREIEEETALGTSDVRIFGGKPHVPTDEAQRRASLFTPSFVDRHNVGERDHVAFVYFGEVVNGREALKSSEHKDLQWFSADDLARNTEGFKPDIVWYALRALEVAKADNAVGPSLH